MIGAAVLMIMVARLNSTFAVASAASAFVVGAAVQYLGSYHLLGQDHLATILSLSWPHRNFLLFSFPFFCAGYLMNKHQVLDRINFWMATVAVVVGIILLFSEALFNFWMAPADSGFDNLVSLSILYPAVFALFIKMEIKVNSKELSRYSTGIYLVHVFIILGIQPVLGNHGTAMTAIVVVAAALSSFVLVKVSKRAPFIL